MNVAPLAFVAAAALTWALIGLARWRAWLAMPNARSSHFAPTPTLGGIAIAVPVLAWAALNAADPLALAILGGGGLLLVLGVVDDLYELPARLRLPLHIVAVLFVLWQLPLPTVLALPPFGVTTSWAIMLIAFLLLLWMINLYNFMDGIDGIAAAQCVCFCAAALLFGASAAGAQLASVAGAAALGFLLFNWAPARIFMGDAASGLLGALCGSLALNLAAVDQVPLVASLILLAGFWFDASYTLCVRIATGQQFAAAHRSHLYQIVARRIGHGRTTLMFIGYFCLWLTPLAAASVRWPSLTLAWLTLAVLPLAVACVRLRAGLPDVAR